MPLPPLPKPPQLRAMDTYELLETTFLWYPYLPVGVATLLFGPGGSGKSHIAIDIAARVSTGRGFPGQKIALPAQNVLMMSAEDEPERVLGPRLVKAGADRSKIFVPDRLFTLDKQGLRYVEGFLSQVSAGIVFIDPIVSYIGGKVDINRSNETREFTGALNILAQQYNIPIIIVGHSRKSTEGREAERAMGSVDFINAVRSVLFTTQAPDGTRIMKHIKTNYAPEGPTQGYAFGANGFEWTGAYKEDGVQEPGGEKRNTVQEWIRKELANGPKSAVDMEEGAKKQGFSHRTLVRAKAGVAESFLVSKEGRMVWYWKVKETSDEEEAKEVGNDIPIMDRQWGNEGSRSGSGGESYPRTANRVREHVGSVEQGDTGRKRPEDQLDQWAKELLG